MDTNLKKAIALDNIKHYLEVRANSLGVMKANIQAAGDEDSRNFTGVTWALDEVNSCLELLNSITK